MLIPQFTLRRLLAVIAACAAFFLIVGSAVAGSKWALAVSIAIAWLVAMLVAYAGAFFVVWLVSLMPFGRRLAHGGSPFRPSTTPALAPAAACGSPFASSGTADPDCLAIGRNVPETGAPVTGAASPGPVNPLQA